MSLQSLKDKLLSNPETKGHYEKIKPEFDISKALISVRRKLSLTQRELAQKAGIKQPQLARIESGKQSPRLETIAIIAASVGYELDIKLVPANNQTTIDSNLEEQNKTPNLSGSSC